MIHFDFENVNRHLDGDKQLIQTFLSLVISELPKYNQELDKYLQEENLSQIKQMGHKLKGTCLSAGLSELTQIAIEINHLTEFDAVIIGELLGRTKKEIDTVLPLLENKRDALI